MGWASGIYTRIFGSTGWQNDKAALIKILASRHDTHDQDIGDGLNTLRTELRGEALTNATKVLTSVAGTNTITASMTSPTPAGTLTSYSAGLSVVLTPANTNNGATTLNVNSLGALDVMNPDGTACIGGELIAGVTTELVLDAGADDWIITSPPFSKAIAPTWTGKHIFSSVFSAGNPQVMISAATPIFEWNQTGAAANNRLWRAYASSEQFVLDASNDAENASGMIMVVDRTGTTVDSVSFPTEASGAVRIGTVAGIVNSSRLYVRAATAGTAAAHLSTANASGQSVLYLNSEAAAGDNNFIGFATDSSGIGTLRGTIDFNRAGTAVRYNTTSDGRLKRNVRKSNSALTLVSSIPVDSFEWIEGGVHIEYGFVAQKLYDVYPDAVSGGESSDPDVIMGIDRGALVPVLTKALQETIDLVASQANSIAALTARVMALEGARAGGK